MGSKHAKTFGMALWSHLVHHSSFLELEQKWKIVSLRMGSKLAKRSEWLSQAIWCITAHSELKTYYNVQNGSLNPFGTSQLFLSSKKNEKWFLLRMRSKLAKSIRMALSSHLVHHSSYWAWKKKWNIISLRMGSKLAKTYRMALLSHLVHHSSFWNWEKN